MSKPDVRSPRKSLSREQTMFDGDDELPNVPRLNELSSEMNPIQSNQNGFTIDLLSLQDYFPFFSDMTTSEIEIELHLFETENPTSIITEFKFFSFNFSFIHLLIFLNSFRFDFSRRRSCN